MKRDTILRRVRLHAALLALESVHGSSEDARFELESDATAGAFVREDGFGDGLTVTWDEVGVVGLEFFHELPDPAPGLAEPAPFGLLEGLPERLRGLATSAFDRCGRRANTGLWLLRDASGERGHIHRPPGLMLPSYAAEELLAPLPGLSDIPSAVSDLAGRIAKSTRYRMTTRDTAIALEDGEGRPPTGIEGAAAALLRLGVVWPDAEAARASLVPRLSAADRALFDAILDDDFAAACGAFAAGAAIDCVTSSGELPNVPAGSTPLLLALRRERDDIAELLIDTGADVERASELGERAILIAAEQGKPALVRQLLARGALASTPEAGFGPLDHIAQTYEEWRGNASRYATVIELLLDAGADTARGGWEILSDLAERGGRADIAKRLRGA